MSLKLASLFDGSGGFPLAAKNEGITPIWASEIEPFPIRVTTKRLPEVKHYGNVAEIDGSEVEPVDIITFGSPCQDMSVAGKRAGLKGSRSNLYPTYSAGRESFFTRVNENISPTLMATDYKDPVIVNQEYTVRRLTPTECARLQGFPDWWCSDLETPEPTAEDIAFWRNVFETHRKIMGTSKKAKTDKQIVKWLKDPHTDSAEYKMWGNGVALPCVQFIMHQIAERDAEEEWHRQVMEEMTIQQLTEQEPELFEV